MKSCDRRLATSIATITDMVADKRIAALWLCGPNHARIEKRLDKLAGALGRKHALSLA